MKLKSELRHDLNLLLKSKSDRELEDDSRIIQSKALSVLSLDQFPKNTLALGFLPLRGEVSVLPLLKKHLDLGHLVAFPRLTAAHDGQECLEFIEPEFTDFILDPAISISWKKGKLGVLIPEGKSVQNELLSKNAFDKLIVYVPGLGFTKDGCRLGRGKGHYDRFLSQVSAYKVAVAFKEQILDALPMDSWDQRVDLVICKNS